MLTWEETVKAVAHLNGYTYTITQGDGDERDQWGVEITTLDGGVDLEIRGTIEEAQQYCENTASEVQGEP